MFEHVILRSAEGGGAVSAGKIAEALLYYRKVHLFLDRGTVFHLVRQIGTRGVLALLQRPEVSATYSEEMLGTHTEAFGASERHYFAAFRLAGHEKVGVLRTPEERFLYELERQTSVSKAEAKRFVRAFLKLVPRRRFSGDHFIRGGIPAAARRDLDDTAYATQAIRQALQVSAEGYAVGDDLKVEIIDSEPGFFLFTNIDFNGVNRKLAATSRNVEPLKPAHLLQCILEARADTALAAHYGGDFVTSAMTSAMIRVRHAEILQRSQVNQEARFQFYEVVLPDAPSLSEAIDSGQRSFDEFLTLLNRASRFKVWLMNVNPDEGLVRTYLRDVGAEGWMETLPAKVLRYVITKSCDAVLPLAGSLAAELADNFILEKLVSGWRPNHFIERRLAPFVNYEA